MDDLLKESKKLQESLIKHRRYLHRNPEIDMNLNKTCDYVINELTKMGYEPKLICDSGIVITVGKGENGKTFLLRADMDALPIKEEVQCEFKSSNENMHACGHDLHTSMLLGAAKLLKENEVNIEGTVKLMFQPGEETLNGAKKMIENGVLENPKVDAAMMMHVFTAMPIESGKVVFVGEGPIQFSTDWFKITVNGKGTHGAMPEEGVDPLNVISHIYLGLQNIIAREIRSSDSTVITIGQMHGGNTGNVIPDTAFLEGTIRTYNNKSREFIKERVVCVANNIAESFRATAKVEFLRGCPCNNNNKEILEKVWKYTQELVGIDNVIDGTKLTEGKVNFGSEDFAYVSAKVPAVTLYLGAGEYDKGNIYPAHHPRTTFDEDILYIGAAIYANAAMKWLENNK